MIELGKTQTLRVLRIKDVGVYLGEPGNEKVSVLLPKRQVPEGTKIGNMLDVFIYRDSEDRLIATRTAPKLEVGQMAELEVREVTKIGAFLDIGLERDVLLPYKEQTYRVKAGDRCLAALYTDRSARLAATMKIYPYLTADSPYQKDDRVTGRVYEKSDNWGLFVAVDNQYMGLIPTRELFGDVRLGDVVEARVARVHEDGKLDLSLRERRENQMDIDAQTILTVIDEYDGVLPFGEKVSPEIIKREFNMSKNAFKRALGHLLKAGAVEITEKYIKRK